MLNLQNRVKLFFRYKILTSKLNYYLYTLIINILCLKILFKKIKYLTDQKKNKYKNSKDSISLKNNGYASLTQGEFIDQANSLASYLLEKSDKVALKNKNGEKAFDKIFQSEDMLSDEKVFNFITNDYLVSIIGSYLKNKPQILHSQVWYSYNDKNLNNTSQEFHLDYEDRKQIKLFLFLNNINRDNGPLITMNKKQSEQIIKKNNYKLSYKSSSRISDELVDKKNANYLTGKKGSVFLIDTSSVFHCGSRKGLDVRKVLVVQYVSPYFTTENKDINKKELLLPLLKKYKDFQSKRYLFDGIFS
jgi:hypothetical protein